MLFDLVILCILVLLIVLCAGLSYKKGRAGGTTNITRPTSDSAVGMGGARGYDYSHVDRLGRAFPVSLRRERKRTDTFKEPRRKKE